MLFDPAEEELTGGSDCVMFAYIWSERGKTLESR